MQGLRDAFITGTGVFLPGEPVPNDRMEDFIGRVGGRPSSIGQRALRWNGINTRHYALTPAGEALHEGLGSIKAAAWGRLVQKRLGVADYAVSFLLYHGENDTEHMKEFEAMLRLVLPDAATAARIATCARVTGRLYAMQIEEIAA